MKTLSQQDEKFISDLIQVAAHRFYKSDKKLSAKQSVMLATKQLGVSINCTQLLWLTNYVKGCMPISK
tara:strand:+ start:158 stop:361 length:204 start_codon:yes stop_codon:yes gene_type:complete